jgi:acyl-CoA reductase-like NAD-dependent aldehyde dehydrogenase
LFNPTNEEKVIDVSLGDEKDVDIAVEHAVKAFKTWKHTTSKERGDLLNKLADALPAYQEEMSYLDAVSMGKPPSPMEVGYICIPVLRSIP